MESKRTYQEHNVKLCVDHRGGCFRAREDLAKENTEDTEDTDHTETVGENRPAPERRPLPSISVIPAKAGTQVFFLRSTGSHQSTTVTLMWFNSRLRQKRNFTYSVRGASPVGTSSRDAAMSPTLGEWR